MMQIQDRHFKDSGFVALTLCINVECRLTVWANRDFREQNILRY